MNKIIAIKDNYSIEITPDIYDKQVSVQLIDEVNNVTTTLATWFGGKWNSDTPMSMNKFFEIIRNYPKVKRTLKKSFLVLKENNVDPTKTVTKTWSCFRRRINVKIHNIVK